MTHAKARILTALSLSVLCVTDSFSAETSASSTQLAEIIVTAQKRAESLQTVPVSITAFSADELQERAVRTFIDYATAVPNLGFGATGDGSANSRSVSIRGISGDGTTGFYIDETPVPDSLDPRIIDTQRIEVLRGPQGTLYGARSMGGTVRVITKQPSVDDFQASIHVGTSSTWNTNELNYLGDGFVNIPLVANRLAVRVVGLYDNEAGFFKRAVPSTPGSPTLTTLNNIAQNTTDGFSISLLWKPTDAISVTPRVMYQESAYNGFPYADATPTNLEPNNFTQTRPLANVPEGGFDRWTLTSLTATYDAGHGQFLSSTSYIDRRIREYEDQTEFFYLVFLSPGGFPPGPSSQTEVKPLHRFVQEFRYASALRGRTQFVVGAFYSNTNGQWNQGEFLPAYVPGLNNVTGYGSDLSYSQTDPSTVHEPALFGEVSYQATEELKLTIGARWYEISTTSSGVQSGPAVGAPPDVVDPEATVKDVGVNPKAQIDYRINSGAMIYATAAKGFRPGGVFPSISTSPAIGCLPQLEAIGVTTDEARRYKSDSLWNYELGAKTEWLENRLTLNGAVFYVDWKDIQQFILLPCGFQFRANAGAAKSEGGEIEAHARPIHGLDVTAGVGYQHAVITENTSGTTTSPQKVGDRVYQVPDWTANAGITYSVPVGNGYSALANLTYAYVGDSKSANNDPFNPRTRAAYSLVDARFALTWSKYEVALVGNNLTNKHANLSDNRSIVVELPGRPRIVVNQPRTIGIEGRVGF